MIPLPHMYKCDGLILMVYGNFLVRRMKRTKRDSKTIKRKYLYRQSKQKLSVGIGRYMVRLVGFVGLRWEINKKIWEMKFIVIVLVFG